MKGAARASDELAPESSRRRMPPEIPCNVSCLLGRPVAPSQRQESALVPSPPASGALPAVFCALASVT
eukprot:8181297-Pyramimonas_sp.AAC.1